MPEEADLYTWHAVLLEAIAVGCRRNHRSSSSIPQIACSMKNMKNAAPFSISSIRMEVTRLQINIFRSI